MGKASPAFQFYPSDFLSSTVTLTDAETGVHIRLLSWSWLNGPLPLDQQRVRRAALSSASDTEWAAIWATIEPRWTKRAGGYTNDRLERTRAEQDDYREKQRVNGLKGGRPKTQTEPRNNPSLTQPLTQTEPRNNPSAFDLRLCSSSLDLDQKHAQSAKSFLPVIKAKLNSDLNANPNVQFSELAETVKSMAAQEQANLHPQDVTALVEGVLQTRARRAKVQ